MSKNFLTQYPIIQDDEYLSISQQGIEQLAQIFDAKDPAKNTQWTVDYLIELPVRMKKSEDPTAKLHPISIPEQFKQRVSLSGKNPALSTKKDGKWVHITFQEFYDQSRYFGQALMKLGVEQYRAVNIIGFNSPEWAIAFFGSILGFYMPVGIYTTNGSDACKYVAEHSDCQVLVAENQEQLQKYFKIWDQLPLLKFAIVYDTSKPLQIPDDKKDKVFTFQQIIDIGKQFKSNKKEDDINYRMTLPKPGNCCTLVYTSGTTGNPKGVMLSHDNYTWTSTSSTSKYKLDSDQQERILSYLPLSHVAAQTTDLIGLISSGTHVFFADSTALQGSLVQYLQDVRPTFFFSVPRVWEKIEEKMRALGASNGFVKQMIANWAKSLGPATTTNQLYERPLSLQQKIATKLVYDNIKKALGLDQARFLIFGAAPLSIATRQYFLSLNMFLINGYGMSECSGPQTLQDPRNFNDFGDHCMKSTGQAISGTDMLIYKPDKDGNGEICYKGRNRFMGYYKNEKATRETIDENGYLHSGDIGKLDEKGNLTITGRLKELIITAGGENVAPVLIENVLKSQLMDIVSNSIVIGDDKKYLTVLITLKQAVDEKQQLIANTLAPETLNFFKQNEIKAINIKEAVSDEKLAQIIKKAIEQTNSQAISKAQHIQKFTILPHDVSIETGELTPTLKLKRNVVHKKYTAEIEKMYTNPSL